LLDALRVFVQFKRKIFETFSDWARDGFYRNSI